MSHNKLNNLLIFVLALIFTIALMFAFVELPKLANQYLQSHYQFPGFDHGQSEMNRQLADLYIDGLHLHWIGYSCMIIVVFLICFGFIKRKSSFVWAGAITMFLPVFGQFAIGMFFLAGLGILRVAWLPFMDSGLNLPDLGRIIYLPAEYMNWILYVFNFPSESLVAWFFMSVGAFLFTWAVLLWFQARACKTMVISNWLYRFSRHPQYLGWILWSYGLMLFSVPINITKHSWTISPSLPWLISTMTILAICMLEELKMREAHGEVYEKYRNKTPFLFPLPAIFIKLIEFPGRAVIRKAGPEKKGDIAVLIITYSTMLVLLSAVLQQFEKKDPATAMQETILLSVEKNIDSLCFEIHKPQHRRYIGRHFKQLEKYDKAAHSAVVELLTSENEVILEFSADLAGDMKIEAAVDLLLDLMRHSNGRINRSAVYALGKIQSPKAVPVILRALKMETSAGNRTAMYTALGNYKKDEVRDALLSGLGDPVWFARKAALHAVYQHSGQRSMPEIYAALEDTDPRIRRAAVTVLLQAKIPQSIPYLKKMLKDEDYETRFYAKQVITLIEENQN